MQIIYKMSNLTTTQLVVFYALIAIISIQAILAILFFRSSVRYYIMISRKIIFRNIEFIDGEIVLIGKQNDEEGVEKLISQGTQKIKFDSRANAPSPMAEEALQNFSTSNIDSGVEDFDYWELNTNSYSVNDDNQPVKIDDLDLDNEIQMGIQDNQIPDSILMQKQNLIEITEDHRSQALDIILKVSTEISNSFLPNSDLHTITNTFEIEICQELEKLNFTEESILFYRQIGNKLICSRFEEFLKRINMLKEELSEREKKKPFQQPDDDSIVNYESEDFFLDRIASLRRKTTRAFIKTSNSLTYQIDFAVSA